MMKKIVNGLLMMAVGIAMGSCVNDDTDFSHLIPLYQVEPASVELDFSQLDEAPDVPVTDVNDSTYNDYVENTTWDKVIYIEFIGDTAVVNGRVSGVAVSTRGAHVVVTNLSGPVQFVLNGLTPDGSLKFYGDKRIQVLLNNIDITNPHGAAINNQGSKSMYVVMADGTTNHLQDGTQYVMDGDEDQKAALFSEGQIIFSGRGRLNVTATGRGGIRSDDYIRIRPGVDIYIQSWALDALRANDGIIMDGGVINVTTTGAGAKGVRSGSVMTVNGGRLVAISSGDTRIENTADALVDTTACAALACDSMLIVNGGRLMLKASGDGGKGINAKRDIDIHGGHITAVATGTKLLKKPKGVKVDGNFSIDGGYFYSCSRRSDPVDVAGTTAVAQGYTTCSMEPKVWTIAY